MNRRLLLAGLLGALVIPLGAAVALVPFASGCSEGRFPVCHTDADCHERDAGKQSHVCVSLRCVECHYDSDCAPGSVCAGTGTCDSLDQRPREDGDAAASEAPSWDPMSWKECAAGCKDQDCVSACDGRFRAK